MRTFEDYLTACVHEAGINNFTEKLVMDFEHPSHLCYTVVLNFGEHQIVINSDESKTTLHDTKTGFEHTAVEAVTIEDGLDILHRVLETAVNAHGNAHGHAIGNK